MNRALNLTDKLSREFPNLSTTMIEQALTVSQGGLAKARSLLSVAKGKANAALAQAHAAGAKVPITAATDGLQKTLVEVLNSGDIEGGLKTLSLIERRIGAGRGRLLTPVEADALKTEPPDAVESPLYGGQDGTGQTERLDRGSRPGGYGGEPQ